MGADKTGPPGNQYGLAPGNMRITFIHGYSLVITIVVPGLDRQIEFVNSKSEIRNPKQARNPNAQNSKRKRLDAWKMFLFWSFEFWSFEFVSDFGFRASDLFFIY
jgi:hypothetical protein